MYRPAISHATLKWEWWWLLNIQRLRVAYSVGELTRYQPEWRHECHSLGGSLFLINAVKRSIGRGKKVVVLCSLEISRIVCRKRNCSAIGSLLIIAAACTIFSAA